MQDIFFTRTIFQVDIYAEHLALPNWNRKENLCGNVWGIVRDSEGWSEYSVPMAVYRRATSSREAMSLTFFSSVPFIPKKVAISTICRSFTKSFGSEQNFSIVGPKSWQLIPFGMRRPSLHSPPGPQCEHNSQIIIFESLRLKCGRYLCLVAGTARG